MAAGFPGGTCTQTFCRLLLNGALPALVLWLGFLLVYARTLWRSIRSRTERHWVERGILLGALGGLAGFFSSGLVHYNWGDSEVVMVFYSIVGMAFVVARPREADADT